MSLYKRGNVWWFKFRFEGQVIRESANTASKTLARDAERARRRELETAVNRIQKRDRMPLFSVAAQDWLNSKSALQPKSVASYEQYVASLTHEFGTRLICDIGASDIAALQRKRLAAGKAARTVNYEIQYAPRDFEAFQSVEPTGRSGEKPAGTPQRGPCNISRGRAQASRCNRTEPVARFVAPVFAFARHRLTQKRSTIRALAGHVSKQMLQRYSHIRAQAKRDAISALERHSGPAFQADGAQNWAQSGADEED
jgi:hypothetical protein